MIIRVWGEIDGKHVDFMPLEGKEDYWYGYCDWSPDPLDIHIWAENHKGARGWLDALVQIQYLDDAKTKCRLVLYPYVVSLVNSKTQPYSTIGRDKFMTESESFIVGEKRRVTIEVRGTNRKPFQVSNASWVLESGDEIESEGVCEIEGLLADKWTIAALIQPMRVDAVYDLIFSYDVNDEHMIQHVRVRTY